MLFEALSQLKESGETPVALKHLFVLVLLILAAPNVTELVNRQVRGGETKNEEASGYEIKQIITKVRDELYETSLETKKKYPEDLFALKSMELDLSFVVKSKKKDTQRAKVELLAVESESEFSKEKTQRIKLIMTATEPPSHRAEPLRQPVGWKEDVKTIGDLPPEKLDGAAKPAKRDDEPTKTDKPKEGGNK